MKENQYEKLILKVPNNYQGFFLFIDFVSRRKDQTFYYNKILFYDDNMNSSDIHMITKMDIITSLC